LKQRLDFPFENKIEAMDRLAKLHFQKTVEITVRFSILKRLKLWTDWLKYTAKKFLKQRLDFPLEYKIQTMDRLAKMHSQTIVKTTVRFSI